MTPNERLDLQRAVMFEEALGIPWGDPADLVLEDASGLALPPEPPTVPRLECSDGGRRA